MRGLARRAATPGSSLRTPLSVGVPGFEGYQRATGIGRVLASLREHWADDVQVVPVHYEAVSLPVLRNIPVGIHAPDGVDLILLPQLRGAQALRRTGGVPSIAVVHDVGIVDFPGDRHGMDWVTWQSIRRGFSGLRHASHIVTVSRFTEERLLRHLPAVQGRVTTIPDGVDRAFLEYSATREAARLELGDVMGGSAGDPLLIYVGSELPRKNIDLLLEVFRRVKEQRPSARLLKIGRAGDPRWRRRTIDVAVGYGLEPGPDLVLLEDIDDRTLAAAYRAADLFISTSLYEGFGLPALEAMATGTPVVVSNRGALPEVVGDAGWVVDPEPDAFMSAVLAALDDPGREARSERSRARAATMTWERSATSYLTLMRNILVRDARALPD